jgi:patatin-related protein
MAGNVSAGSEADVAQSLWQTPGVGNPPAMQLNDLSREVRFGIVLYGGVSLAVYENGVAQELFRATKGAGIYTVIKQLTGSDIVLDIISGTSAGGINGILIGYALANGKDPSNCGDLWRNDGDILSLLHHPWDLKPNSILDSEGYYQPHLADAFKGLSRKYEKAPDDLAAQLEDLDLFVTGTNAYGDIYTEFDSFGHLIDVKNHRALFHLRYRCLIEDDNDFQFSADHYAKLSRITSCFPVAFAPVQVNGNPGQDEDPADEQLRRWGKLTEDKQYFLDGGILNNKPFSSTLRAIFHHTQTREVERLLVYVEPDPEFFQPNPTNPPSVLTAAMEGLSSIPGYQSIAEDLDAIGQHNDWVARYKEIESGLTRVSEKLMEKVTFASPATISDLTTDPEQARSDTLMKGNIFNDPGSVSNLERAPEQAEIYLRSRLTQVRERVLEGILKIGGHLLYLKDGQRRAAELLVEKYRAWQEGIDLRDRSGLLQALLRFDIYYRMRRLFYVTNAISQLLNGTQSIPLSREQQAKYRDLWRRLNHRLKLLDIVRAKMEQLLDCADFHWEQLNSAPNPDALAVKIWENAQTFLAALLERDAQLNGTKLPSLDAAVLDWNADQEKVRVDKENQERVDLYRILTERGDAWTKFSNQNPIELKLTAPADILLKQTDDDEWEIFQKFAPHGRTDLISQHYCRFIFVDMYLFPMQYMSGFEATDKVTTVRFSPRDAKLGFSNDPRKKLCGNELGHFGGFLKSSWRANDLMWGRLDAACQIIQSVLTFDNLKHLKDKLKDQAQQQYIIDSLRDRCKNSENAAFDAVAKDLGSFIGETERGAEENAFKGLLEDLVCMAQREILQVEIPNVIEASIAQQGAWNNYDLPREIAPSKKKASKASRWRSDRHQSDRVVTTYAALAFAQHLPETKTSLTDGTMPPPAADRTIFPPGWGAEYFCNKYDFGGETWQTGVPKSVTIEILTTMLLVLRKCMVTTGGDRAASVARSMFAWIATLPIWLGYALTRVQRLAPEYFTNTVVLLGVLSTLALAADVGAHFFLGMHIGLKFWVIPSVALLTLMVLFWLFGPEYFSTVVILIGILCLAVLLADAYLDFAQGTHLDPRLWVIPIAVLFTLLFLLWFILRKNRASNAPINTARLVPWQPTQNPRAEAPPQPVKSSTSQWLLRRLRGRFREGQ